MTVPDSEPRYRATGEVRMDPMLVHSGSMSMFTIEVPFSKGEYLTLTILAFILGLMNFG